MHKAAANDKIRILDLLLKSGANINVQDDLVSDYILIVIHM